MKTKILLTSALAITIACPAMSEPGAAQYNWLRERGGSILSSESTGVCPAGTYYSPTGGIAYCVPCQYDNVFAEEDTTTEYYCPGVDVDELFQVDVHYYDYFTIFGRCRPGQVVDLSQFDGTEGSECVTSTPSRTPGRIAKDETNPECDDTTLGTASGSTDFEADWTANTINITWANDGVQVGTSTCTYDQSFNLPTPPTKTGYNFAGWKVKSGLAMCSGGTLTSSTSVSAYGYTRLNGDTGDKEADYGLTPGSGEWAVTVPTGIVKGMARCSTVGSGYDTSQIATEEITDNNGTGQYCWCQTTSYTPTNGGMCMSASSSWVFFPAGGSASNCALSCPTGCAYGVRYNNDGFRGVLFGLLGA